MRRLKARITQCIAPPTRAAMRERWAHEQGFVGFHAMRWWCCFGYPPGGGGDLTLWVWFGQRANFGGGGKMAYLCLGMGNKATRTCNNVTMDTNGGGGERWHVYAGSQF